MRGCYVELDDEDRYLFVGGYHDGRVSMMRLVRMAELPRLQYEFFIRDLDVELPKKSLPDPMYTV